MSLQGCSSTKAEIGVTSDYPSLPLLQAATKSYLNRESGLTNKGQGRRRRTLWLSNGNSRRDSYPSVDGEWHVWSPAKGGHVPSCRTSFQKRCRMHTQGREVASEQSVAPRSPSATTNLKRNICDSSSTVSLDCSGLQNGSLSLPSHCHSNIEGTSENGDDHKRGAKRVSTDLRRTLRANHNFSSGYP